MISHRTSIDINCDVGERPAALVDGSERQLLEFVSSANIACGGHAGDRDSMKLVVDLCVLLGVSIGAHPSYPDRAGFGRARIEIDASGLKASIQEQVTSLMNVARAAGTRIHHVKPHGALYNAAVKDPEVASVIASAVLSVDRRLLLVGLAGSGMLRVWRDAGLSVVGEAFADRQYEADGTLRPRSFADALIVDPDEAARRVLGLVCEGEIVAVGGKRLTVDAQTICIHSDTENAIALARSIHAGVLSAGIAVKPF